MALSRRFLNLIVDNGITGAKSLHWIDLTLHNFFNATPPPQSSPNRKESQKLEAAALNNMDTIHQLPSPVFNFTSSSRPNSNDQRKTDCFPLVDNRVICADHLGRSFLFEADTHRVSMLPPLHQPKSAPISLFVDGNDGDGGGSLYIMERIPKWGVLGNNQLEAFINCYQKNRVFKSWGIQLLPPPPFVYDRAYLRMMFSQIGSYALVGDGGSNICISVNGVGTYCLDMRSLTWSKFGEWTLPFRGKVEYVPELKLWVGLSENTQEFAAADLSSMDSSSQPQLVGGGTCGKEFDPPETWRQCEDSQLVNLDSNWELWWIGAE